MTIYRIEPDVDNYCSLLLADRALAASDIMAFDGTLKADRWPNPMAAVIDHADAPMPDILDIGSGNLVLFGRASALIRDEVASYCELLPVIWDNAGGEAVNVIGLNDCLDAESCKWVLGVQSGKRIRIERHEFLEHRVPQRLLFKIPERRYETFCTGRFAELLKVHRLKGINMVPVWTTNHNTSPPLPRG